MIILISWINFPLTYMFNSNKVTLLNNQKKNNNLYIFYFIVKDCNPLVI